MYYLCDLYVVADDSNRSGSGTGGVSSDRTTSNLIRNNHSVEGVELPALPECTCPRICTEPEDLWELGQSWARDGVASCSSGGAGVGTGAQVVGRLWRLWSDNSS